MKYITGNTQQERVICNVLIPRSSYTQSEIDAGKSKVALVSDDKWEELRNDPHFRDLLANDMIKVHDQQPYGSLTANEKLASQGIALSDAQHEITELKNQLAAAYTGGGATAEVEVRVTELEASIAPKDARIAELETALAAKEEEFVALRAEATEALTAKDEQITELKAALKKKKGE